MTTVKPVPSEGGPPHPQAGQRSDEVTSSNASPLLLPTADVLLRLLLAMLTAAGVVRWCVDLVANGASYLGTYDFSFYYDAALAYRDNIHANIYDPHLLRATADAHHVFLGVGVYQYPPLLPLVFLPLTLVSFQTASRIWMFLNVIFWVAGTVMLVGLLRRALYGAEPPPLRGRSDRHSLAGSRPRLHARFVSTWQKLSTIDLFAIAVATFVSLTYAPLAQSVALGQASMSIFFLAVLAAWLLRHGRMRWAGAALGLATMIKLLPIVLVVYFVLRGSWRVVAGAVATIAVLLAGMAAILGVDGVLAMRAIPTNGAGDSMRFQNEALSRIPMWIAIAFGGRPSALLLDIGYALIAVVALAFAATVIYVTRSARPPEAPVPGLDHPSIATLDLLGYDWVLCTMVLVSPIYWEHHAAWLVPALLFGLGYTLRLLARGAGSGAAGVISRGNAAIIAGLLIGGYVLTMIDLPFAYDSDSAYNIGPYFLHVPLRPFFMLIRPIGTLLLWAASGMLFWRLGSTSMRRETQVAEG